MSEMFDIEVSEVTRRVMQCQLPEGDLTDGEANLDHALGSTLDSNGVDGTLTEDPESPRDIVHENVLTIFPLALFFVFLVFGLVIGFSE